jgi:hypothetical protein
MANIWWRNLTSDNDANNINNYATTEGGTTVPGGTLADHTIYFSATASTANWTLTDNLIVVGLYNLSDDTGGTDNYTGTWSGNYTLSAGTITTGGTDAGNKLTWNCGLIVNITTLLRFSNAFVNCTANANGTTINLSGATTVSMTPNADFITGQFEIVNTGECNYSNFYFGNRFSKYSDISGAQLNLTSTGQLIDTELNLSGEINNGTYAIIASGANFTLNSTAVWTGESSAAIRYVGISISSFVNNVSGQLDFAGYIEGLMASTNRGIFSGPFGNAEYRITNTVSIPAPLLGNKFKLTIKDFTVTLMQYDGTVDFSSNYSEIEVLGDLSFVKTSGSGNLSYIKGGELWTLAGASNTCDFNGKEVNDITIASGASYTDGGGFACTDLVNSGSLTLDPTKTYSCVNPSGSGIYRSTGATVYVQYTGDYDFTGTLDNVVFVKSNAQPINGANKKLGIMIAI